MSKITQRQPTPLPIVRRKRAVEPARLATKKEEKPTRDADATAADPFAHLVGQRVATTCHVAYNFQQRVAAYLGAGLHFEHQ